MPCRVCLAEALTTTPAEVHRAANSSGLLLHLFSAVLCPALSWPSTIWSFTGLHG